MSDNYEQDLQSIGELVETRLAEARFIHESRHTSDPRWRQLGQQDAQVRRIVLANQIDSSQLWDPPTTPLELWELESLVEADALDVLRMLKGDRTIIDRPRTQAAISSARLRFELLAHDWSELMLTVLDEPEEWMNAYAAALRRLFLKERVMIYLDTDYLAEMANYRGSPPMSSAWELSELKTWGRFGPKKGQRLWLSLVKDPQARSKTG